MGIFQRVDCLRGNHYRNRKMIWLEGQTFHSRCSGCGKAMVRGLDGWRLAEAGGNDPLRMSDTSWFFDMRG